MNQNEFIKEAIGSVRKHDDRSRADDMIADNYLVAIAGKAMAEKLEAARKKGRGGWWREDCAVSDLRQMLRDHIKKGDMRDVMNLAAMIFVREIVDGGLVEESPNDAFGVAKSCGKPLCSSGNHHPLCKLPSSAR